MIDFTNTTSDTWTSVENLGNGIFLYHGIFLDLDIINRLEDILSSKSNDFKWEPGIVGHDILDKKYRDCFDFKFKRTDFEKNKTKSSQDLVKIWDDCYRVQLPAVNHYRVSHNLAPLNYWEAFNFIKYSLGNHFEMHNDHGYSYNCVVSLAGYLNDNYDGGEIYFPNQEIKIKPLAGDLLIFPSGYMHPHKVFPVTGGTKYSVVTMLDYTDKGH